MADEPAAANEEPAASSASTQDEGASSHGETAATSRFGRPGLPFRQSPFLFGLTGALGVAVAWGLVQAVINVRQVIVLLVVALFLALGLNPAVEFLQRHKIPRRWAVTIVFVCLLVFVVGFFAAIVPPLVQQSTDLWQNHDRYLAALQNSGTIRRLDAQFHVFDRARRFLDAQGQALGARLAGGLFGAGRAILSGVFTAFTVLILTLYFLASLPRIKQALYRLAPRSRRERVTLLADEVTQGVGGYLSGAAVIAFTAGLTSFIWLLAWRLPYALPLALCVLLLDLIPMIGATIAGVLLTLVALTSGLVPGIITAAYYIAYQQTENYLIYPRVMRKAVKLPAVMTVVAALIGGSLLGIVGALLAIPMAAGLLLVVREVVLPRLERA